MKWYPFAEVVSDVTSKFRKIKASEYQPAGQFKIIDQGKDAIAGYTSDKTLINDEQLPIIIFGDHTRVLKYEENPIALGADGAKALKVDPEIANTLYVYYYLKSIKLKEAGYSRHFKFLKETKVPIPTKDDRPSLDEQIRIAHLLGKVEGLIAQRKQHLQQLDDLLKSVFLEMFGPQSIGYPNWPLVEIKDLAAKHKGAMRTGPFGSNLLHSEFATEGDVAVLGIDNAVQNRFAWSERRYITHEKYRELESYRIFPGDVIITIMGTIGRSAVIPKDIPLTINTKHLAAITLNTAVANPLFVSYSIHSSPFILNQFRSKNRGAIMSGLNLGLIKETKLKRPPIEWQNKFAAIHEKIDSVKSRYKHSLTQLEILYGALSQQAFMGELDLSRVVLPESI